MTSIYGTDSLTIEVPVTESGNAYDLTGCSIAAVCKNGASAPIAGTTQITNAAGGVFTVTYAAGTFQGAAGTYDLQCRVTNGAEVQTVLATTFTVIAAITV
ncbi:hypothetical protein QEZ52_00355 [Aliisedimentitalea scapharcae]|uniref:BppU N-terminal domain-containing protein n=1 Tax=Aliisedimentitalea scapharcae TaxID=1524259 RepID=A0ABZ2XSH5_9RHOB